MKASEYCSLLAEAVHHPDRIVAHIESYGRLELIKSDGLYLTLKGNDLRSSEPLSLKIHGEELHFHHRGATMDSGCWTLRVKLCLPEDDS